MKEAKVIKESHLQLVRKKGLALISALFVTLSINAGDVVSHSGLSSAWVRMPSRNASTGIDAVYYNPAGLLKSKNGLYFSISNLSVFKNFEIENSYTGKGGNFPLNNRLFEGSSKEYISPSFYAVYKKDRFALSLGYYSFGLTGNTVFRQGVPSFDLDNADIIPFLPASTGATAYESDIYLNSTASMNCMQGGFSYKINEIVSLSAGIRYLTAKSIMRGHILDIRVFVSPGVWTRADQVINDIVNRANNASQGTSGNRGTTDLLAAGLGTLTLAQVPLSYISQERREQLEGSLTAFGYPANTIIETADAVFRGIAEKYYPAAGLLGDRYINYNMSGNGITPFFSLNISPSGNLNIAIKYEMGTRLKMKSPGNSTIERNDLPAQLSAGVSYLIGNKTKLALGSDYYFNKSSIYNSITDINGLSVHAGAEYKLTSKILLSGGYLFSNKGVNIKYQNDLNYNLGSHQTGFGVYYSVNKMTGINLGASYIFYIDESRTIEHTLFQTSDVIEAFETYRKSGFILAAGIDFNF